MASQSMVPEKPKAQPIKGKRHLPQDPSVSCDGEGDGPFVFEANEAWKDFHNSLLHFYEAGELSDVTLKVGSKLIACHKLVLACVIPYFRAMFLSDMAEAKQTLIEIKDFDGDAIEDLVKFAYSSRLTLTVDNVQPLLYAACILQVELVARACCEYMKLHFHPSNCLAVRAFAESHNRIDLMDMADRYACEHFADVVECEDFVSMSPQHLHKLLSSSDLNIENEKQVYSAAVKWLHANPQHHEVWLDEILAQVGEESIACVIRGFISSFIECKNTQIKSCTKESWVSATPFCRAGISEPSLWDIDNRSARGHLHILNLIRF